MVFKIICVGSIPAILVIRLACHKSRKLHKLSRHALFNKKKKFKSKWLSKLKLTKSFLKARASRFFKNKLYGGPSQLSFKSAYLTSNKSISVNSVYHSNSVSAKIPNSESLGTLTFLYFSLIYLQDVLHAKSKVNINQVWPLHYKLSSVLNFMRPSTATIDTTYSLGSVRDTLKSPRTLHKSALRLQINRAWSLNTFSNLTRTGLTQEPIIAHDGNVPLIFFSSIDSKYEFLASSLFLIHEDLSNGASSSLKRTKHYIALKNQLTSAGKKNAAAKLGTVRSKSTRLYKGSFISRLRAKRKRRLRNDRRKLYLKAPKLTLRLKSSLSVGKGKRMQGRLFTIYARIYHSPANNVTRVAGPRSSLTKLKASNANYDLADSLAPNSLYSNTLLTHKKLTYNSKLYTNVYPDSDSLRTKLRKFSPQLTRQLNFYPDITPWVTDTLIRLIETCAGKRAMIQHNMNVEHMVEAQSKLLYRSWIVRMAYYERTLGHRFFMEEALHIMHLSLRLHDVKLFSSWLKAIITRISFWKTRSIFRFLKYVFNNYYRYMFDSLSVKGIKIRLKGKISAAGNSRKRTIIFRSGQNSYSSVNVKCLHEFKTITTFTGVMGFQVWLFY